MGGRKTDQTDVPAPEDPDRKRVLNVLAQRRYRQRQRNRLAELEKKARLPSTEKDGQDSRSISPQSESREEEGIDKLPADIGVGTLTGHADAEDGTQCQFQFPSDATLEVPELKVVDVIHDIAVLLQCEDTIRNIKSIRTFTSTTCPSGHPLPTTFLPTHEQKRIPHHPVLDLLPWPPVRSKLIRVFNRSPNIRPPVARDPLAMMTLLNNMETPEDGLRVNGRDGYEADNWEVGQRFFANWWWALECEIVERSSALRVLRGKESLFVEG
ncbi:hypothetical protein IFR04_004678 [Cadophora malorum]|uniref:BZIP domain-containing protein n=1 Tax=Cadophora malorum TaxID=108018 RepID=A0A8H7WCB6_9HELO|nr:hypothetical protein IFR04_004678 [Cadophora malorum]